MLNKCAEDVLHQFEQHAVIQSLRVFCEALSKLNMDLDVLDAYLKFYLSREVKNVYRKCCNKK